MALMEQGGVKADHGASLLKFRNTGAGFKTFNFIPKVANFLMRVAL